MTVLKAEVGMEIADRHGHRHVVREGCGGKAGAWVCLTHRKWFGNQFEKDSHIMERGRHVLAWACAEHGMEVP